MVKNLPAVQESWVQSLGLEGPLEKEMAKKKKKEGNGNPFQYSSLENSLDRGAWWATVHDVTKESDMT